MSKETRFLCRLIGLYCLVVALVSIADEQGTVQTITSLMHDPPLMFVLGVMLLFAGLAMTLVHNIWSGGPAPVIVTLISWLTLVKGLAFLALAPLQITDFYLLQLRFGQLYYVYAVMTLVLGGYLTNLGFRGNPALSEPRGFARSNV
jgi:vacuolar-type H+-ATPase subunit I/STV1